MSIQQTPIWVLREYLEKMFPELSLHQIERVGQFVETMRENNTLMSNHNRAIESLTRFLNEKKNESIENGQ